MAASGTAYCKGVATVTERVLLNGYLKGSSTMVNSEGFRVLGFRVLRF